MRENTRDGNCLFAQGWSRRLGHEPYSAPSRPRHARRRNVLIPASIQSARSRSVRNRLADYPGTLEKNGPRARHTRKTVAFSVTTGDRRQSRCEQHLTGQILLLSDFDLI